MVERLLAPAPKNQNVAILKKLKKKLSKK